MSTYSERFAEMNQRAEERLCAMKRRCRERMENKLVKTGKVTNFSIFSGKMRKDVSLTDSESRVIEEFKRAGVRALGGETCHKWCAESAPMSGWCLCTVCNLPMPASKVEFSKSEGVYNVVWFYHVECYLHITDQSILHHPRDRGVRRYDLEPRETFEEREATSRDDAKQELVEKEEGKIDHWDLDKPDRVDYD
eukprot:jgi/Mesvir1/17/Mv19995-RA.1